MDSSTRMAASTDGSATNRANRAASAPAAQPAAIPRRTLAPIMLASVAGNAEQMPGVVEELVQHAARGEQAVRGERGDRALIERDEVHRDQQRQQRAERRDRELPRL